MPLMRRTETISLDFDWFWRVGLVRLFRALENAWNRLSGAATSGLDTLGRHLRTSGRRYFGSRVDDEPTDFTSLTVDLGTIEPNNCRKAAWDMITTRLPKAVSRRFARLRPSTRPRSSTDG